MFPLGRKHKDYGAKVLQMETLGLLMVKSLMKAIPKDIFGEAKHNAISGAYFAFFKIIVYWLTFGLNYETRITT